MNISRSRFFSLTQWSALILFVPAAFAQSSSVRPGTVEVGPFIGASYGIDSARVMGGGNITYALKNRIVLPYFELGYFPGLPHSSTDINGTVYKYSTGLTDVHGGVHIRLPWLTREKPVVPYLVFGMGALHAGDSNGTATAVKSTPDPQKFPGSTSFAFNGGGGLRWYLGGSGKYGIRVEAKVYKATSGDFSNSTIGKVEFGFFRQFR